VGVAGDPAGAYATRRLPLRGSRVEKLYLLAFYASRVFSGAPPPSSFDRGEAWIYYERAIQKFRRGVIYAET
jgi:hypothetical protein